MRIAVIGAGNVGGTLGRRWAALGHEVTFGVREGGDVKGGAPPGAQQASVPDACRDAEVIELCTPRAAAPSAIASMGPLGDKVLFDSTNPIAAGFRLDVGPAGESGAERLAALAIGARVVKVFNTTRRRAGLRPGRCGAAGASARVGAPRHALDFALGKRSRPRYSVPTHAPLTQPRSPRHNNLEVALMSLKDPNVTDPKHPKRVAIVIANPSVSSTTGWPVGFWWSELTHPYFVLTEHGYEVEIFSPNGGRCEADGMSDPRDASGYSSSDLISMGFIATSKLAALVESTRKVAEIDVERFDAIVVAGGQAPMFTFEKAVDLHRKFVEFYDRGKIACALCHGVAVLRYARLANGKPLAEGKTVTGFANVEEDFADNAVWSMNLLPRDKHVMPWRIEEELKRLGANFVQAGLWRAFAVRDGNLITGQQNFSGGETAELIVEALGR